MPDGQLLSALSLPSRYESLVRKIGPEVLRLLVPPARATVATLEEAADAVISLGEGLFLPIHAESGTGKTTLAENLTVFLPTKYAPTLSYDGEVTSDGLSAALELHMRDKISANDRRVIPINVDHREGSPPTGGELSQIKRFLRQDSGHRALLVWPDTSSELASELANAYRKIAGVLPISIPVQVEGPPNDRWLDLAAQTLALANDVDSLSELVDLNEYDTETFSSIGDFLKAIATDFNRRRLDLIRATVRDVRLTIVWVSETAGHGILSSLTSSRRYGMLDPMALIQACGESVVGNWWAAHRGLLVQTIVALDAHVLSVSPPFALATFVRYGPPTVQGALRDLGFANRTPADVTTYLGRSDLGRRLAGEARAVGEGRGNPAEDARVTFETLAENIGFQGGRDKQLNRAFAEAIRVSGVAGEGAAVTTETALPFLPALIPDVAVTDDDRANCIEFTYRKGDYLTSSNRSTIAQYCLTKLKNYARSMGWVSSGE
ncbi:hypothetical protein MN032_01305 [Agromyces atrinae]|uniref:hypothetical protein n=1 Tax=Agromyces atrinae TaxID=592376 RepID=UPI001F5961E9|nr:hypothetical protein [Agromyces atrinae]MCI2956313.1 hypothetical protein [Agromyces atrinae]